MASRGWRSRRSTTGLVAASFALLGENAFAARLPVALAVTGLVLLVYSFGSRFFGRRAGFYAGLVMCTGVGTFLFTRVMIPEAILRARVHCHLLCVFSERGRGR